LGVFDSFVSTLGKFEPVGIEVHVEVRVDSGADVEAAVDAPSNVDVEDTSKDDDKSFPPPKSSSPGSSSIKKDWLFAPDESPRKMLRKNRFDFVRFFPVPTTQE
jgi:hypothetical protein